MLFRPSATYLLPVPYIPQRLTGECLAACVVMVCTYLDISVHYSRLVRQLRIERGLGTPFRNITNLNIPGVDITHNQFGTLEMLYESLQIGYPTIVSVQTAELPHWNGFRSQHVVVVRGMSPDYVFVNDPGFSNSGAQIPIGDFDLAWLEQDEEYAALSLV